MLRKKSSHQMGTSNLGWLNSLFHFSFAEYYHPENINFGVLRVLNDDLIQAGTGFDLHPHRDMEIISYVVAGELTHADNLGNQHTLTRGNIQYMSAGTGIFHSEHNKGNELLRFLQIWIYPDKNGYEPSYGDYEFQWADRQNEWLHMVSSQSGLAPVKIHQDVNIYALTLNAGMDITFPMQKDRQAYLVQIEGTSTVNHIELKERDALESIEESLMIQASTDSHFLLIEMKKE